MEIVIGKDGQQPFEIDTPGVSRRHARIVIDNGIWTLEDLNSTNGTYVQDEQTGEYVRIGKKIISPITRIRLGNDTVTGGITFSARKAVPEMAGKDYKKEFEHINELYEELQEEIERLRKKKKQRQILIALLPMALMFLSIPMKGSTGMWFMRGSLGLTSVLSLLFVNNEKERMLMERNERLLVCPCCGKPLNKYDIKSHSHFCGAKG